MSLREYAEKIRQPDTPMGDFIGDVRRDWRLMDRQFESWDEFENYLAFYGADSDVLALGARFWRRYQKWHQKWQK